jgi:uncharacterized protein DUF4350
MWSYLKGRFVRPGDCLTGCPTLLLILALAIPALAAPFDPEGTDWEGLAQLVTLARAATGRDRVVVARSLDLEALSPADSLLIVHPQRHLDTGEIENFITAGGRVALLDDFGTGSELLAHFGIRRIPLPSNPARRLRSNPALALAERPAGPQSLPETLGDLREMEPVVTNHATGLGDTGLLPLLYVRGRGGEDVLLAVAGAFGHGHFLAVGDASVAINAMLRYPGNRTLAVSLVRYLSEESDAPSPRHGRLYIVANDAIVAGEFGAPPHIPKPLRIAIVEIVDALKQGMPPTAAYVCAVGVGLGIILWASSRAGRTYRESLPRFVRPTSVAAHGGLAGHAASLALGSPLRALAELRRTIEEQIAIRLGLERPAAQTELLARVRTKGMLGESDARDLERLLARLSWLEGGARGLRPRWKRLKRAELLALVERSRVLLAAMDEARRDRLAAFP